MTDPPAAKERRCCTSYVNYPHDPACTSKGGRTPTAAGTAPNRNIRIHDADWDPCVAQANADGQPISVFVREAITRELDRRRRRALTASARPANVAVFIRDDGTVVSAHRARVCACDDDECGGTCAGSVPATGADQ